MNDCGVITAAQGTADLLVADAGQFACKVYGNCSCGDDRPTAGMTFELLLREFEIAADDVQDFAQLRLPGAACGGELFCIVSQVDWSEFGSVPRRSANFEHGAKQIVGSAVHAACQ